MKGEVVLRKVRVVCPEKGMTRREYWIVYGLIGALGTVLGAVIGIWIALF